ncbi:hypothetical protein ABG768_010596 [Culter alburnus]|uniref:Uncharacterized protein n=1 Tax=Culter alburnus TaxID=194366 RepID=A0AAW1ZEL3_CULAL
MSSRGEKGEEGQREGERERERGRGRGRGRKQTREESGSKRVSVKEGSLTAQKRRSANSTHSLSQLYSEHGRLVHLSSRKQFPVQRERTETDRNRGSGLKRGEVLCGEMDSDSGDQSEGELSPGKGSVLSFSSSVSQTWFAASGSAGEHRHVLLLFSLTHLTFIIVLIFLAQRDSL